MTDVEPAEYPCQQVVGEGQLCMEPCDSGFVRCRKHRNGVDKRGLAIMLEETQDRVLRRVASAIDPAITMLIDLAQNARNESARLQAIDKLLTLAGFANIKIDAQVGVSLDPQSRDAVLMRMIREMAEDPTKMQALTEKSDIVDVDSTEL